MSTVSRLLLQPLENRLGCSNESIVCFVQRTAFYKAHPITRPTSQHSRSGLLLFSLVLGTQPSGLGLEISLVLSAVTRTGVRMNGPGPSSHGNCSSIFEPSLLLGILKTEVWIQVFQHQKRSHPAFLLLTTCAPDPENPALPLLIIKLQTIIQ